MMRKGIAAGGNWIIDQLKIIDQYPEQDALANILSQSQANGGSPYNILKNLALMKAPFPLFGFGKVGQDANGKFILQECKSLGIDVAQIQEVKEAPTSYTDVMTVMNTGRRTFFHARGANDLLAVSDFDFTNIPAKIFHLGYLLLLKELDDFLEDGSTKASVLFENAQKLGLKTSADVVSESSNRFPKVVKPSLPHLDYLFLNEFEAERITEIPIKTKKGVDIQSAKAALKTLLDWGVKEWVVMHFPEGALAFHKKGTVVFQPSLRIPASKIKGSAGAGDAFASGVLYGLHEEWEITKCLQAGVCTAAASLFEIGCSDGVMPLEQCLELGNTFGFQ